MPNIIYILLFKFIVETVRAIRRYKREARPEPLWTGCSYAHLQYGTKARRAISCAYGGVVQIVKLDVYIAPTIRHGPCLHHAQLDSCTKLRKANSGS